MEEGAVFAAEESSASSGGGKPSGVVRDEIDEAFASASGIDAGTIERGLKPPEGSPGRVQGDTPTGKTVAEIFGEIVWLMGQDSIQKKRPIEDLESLIMPPILYRQIRVFYAPTPESTANAMASVGVSAAPSATQPVGAVLWAMTSDAVAAALDADHEGRLRLTPQDWRSGLHRRIVLTLAPFRRSLDVDPE